MPKSRFPKPGLMLRLYIAGDAPNSLSAIENTKTICETHFPAAHTIEIIDMLVDPLRALADLVIVTPTLLKLAPLPARRMIGNLNDTSQVLRILGVNERQ